MKYVAWLIIIGAVLVVAHDFMKSSGPSSREVEPKLRAFLTSAQYSNCEGYATITNLSDIRVGRYYKEAGGWPVFASYDLTCSGRSGTLKYSWRNGCGQNTPIAFARKYASGELELFTCGSSQDMQQNIRQNMQSAFGQMQKAEDQRITAEQRQAAKRPACSRRRCYR